MSDWDPGDRSETRRRIYLVRHGAVEYFDRDGRPHVSQTVPLSEKGRNQAMALGELLQSVDVDRVVTSDLPRTIETATIALRERAVEIDSRPELREIEPGDWKTSDPTKIAARLRGAFLGGIDRHRRFLEGETFGDFWDRVVPCFDRLVAEADWRRMLIVAHGGVNRAIICRALGLGLTAFGSLEQDTACLNVIDLDTAHGDESSDRFIVRQLNYTAYDGAKTGIVRTTMEQLYFDFEQLIAGAAKSS